MFNHRMLILVIMLVLGTALSAAGYIAGLPMAAVQKDMDETAAYQAVSKLAALGYGVLHYDRSQLIAIVPDAPAVTFTEAVYLADYPARDNLYLIGKVAGKALPEQAGKVLLEMDAAVLLESTLSDLDLRDLISQPFTLLSMDPMRFPNTSLSLTLPETTRTDITQLVSLVSTASVQGLIQSLQGFQTRYARADNRQQVAEWIRQQFISYGVTNAQLQPFTWQNTTQYNVVATITGTVYPDQYIIVGGHHDSVSSNSDPYNLAPGADDNASGTVATLEMARVMMQSGYQPRSSIRFVTFAAEEFGLWGSKYYAQVADNADQNIRLMINHDMLANNAHPNWLVRLCPYDGSMDHSAYAAQITEQYTSLTPWYDSMNSASSDSHSFWQRGYNVIYFFESDFSEVYHTDQDLVANIDPAYCAEVIKASVACAAVFADMPSAAQNLQILDTGLGTSLQASWDAIDDPDIAHFNVYVSTTQGQWGTPVSTTQNTLTINNLTEGQTYYFAVSAEDTFGNESYLVYASGMPLSVPLEPQNFSDQPLYQGISLSWSTNSELDLAGYKLFRSQTEGVLGAQIGGILAANSYTDSDVQGDQGYYFYSLCAVDLTGNSSPFAQVVKSRPITLDQGILIVDETADLGGTNPFQPTDAQADDFYSAITQGFDTTQLDINSLSGSLRLADIGVYSSVLWHGNDFASMDYPFGVKEALTQYIQAGGNVFFSVYNPSLAFALNAGYPASFAPSSFINSVIGIEETDFSSSARFRFATPVHDQFPAVSVDPLKSSPSLNGHILHVESIGPNSDCATVYNYGSDYAASTPQGVMNNLPVGVLNLSQSGKVLTLSFPLYNLYQDDAADLVEYVFTEYFNESATPVNDPQAPPAASISLSAGHPNPFRSKTSFRVELKNNSLPIQVGIYNLRGQLLRTVWAGNSPKSLLIEWDGKDENGLAISSGVYFVRAEQNGENQTRKIMLIK